MVNTPRQRITVSELKQPPFGRISGRLSPLAGVGEFAELSIHKDLLETIAKRSVKPTSFWLLGGAIGSGKTWTLSWLLRDGAARLENLTHHQWSTVGFPFPAKGLPDRAFLESFFATSDELRIRARENVLKSSALTSPRTPYSRAARIALSNNDVWGTLCGESPSFPRKPSRPSLPSWAKEANRIAIFIEFLKIVRTAGFVNLLIIVDEFEAAATTSGTTGLGRLSHFFRQLHDDLGTMPELPRTEVILAATREVVSNFVPPPEARPATKVRTPHVLVQALRDRMDPPFYLDRFTEKDALVLADVRIGVARMSKTKEKYIPYSQEAISLAYENCLQNIRTFVTSLEAMYEEALAGNVDYIDVAFAKKVLKSRGLVP